MPEEEVRLSTTVKIKCFYLTRIIKTNKKCNDAAITKTENITIAQVEHQ